MPCIIVWTADPTRLAYPLGFENIDLAMKFISKHPSAKERKSSLSVSPLPIIQAPLTMANGEISLYPERGGIEGPGTILEDMDFS